MLTAAPAAADDYAATARNIIPSGQYGSVPPPAGADAQALMYDSLTPLFDQVTAADLQTKFKSANFGVGEDGPGTVEPVPRPGVTIVRDRFNVPHITGQTRDDVTWAMGWLLAEDRGLLLAQARDAARLAAIDAPNINAFGLVINLSQYTPTPEVDRIIQREGDAALRAAGAAGRAVRHDIDVYLQGVNAKLGGDRPWTRVDVYASNAIIGQIFGEGGGDEARRSEFFDRLRDRFGRTRGQQIFDDLAEFDDPDSPTTISRTFRYGRAERSGRGQCRARQGFLQADRPERPGAAASAPRRWASNFLMVGASRSTNGHPLFVAGPQIGYTYPGLTMEVDVSYPGVQARGATAPGFAGNVLIGRGQDYAWSLTSAGSDLIDTFAETLCGGSRTKYLYKGRCRTMGRVDAGRIAGSGRVVFRTTVHGPVIGYGEGQRPHRRAVPQARELRPRHPLAARIPGPDGRHGQVGRDVPGRRWRARRSRSTSPTPTTVTSRCTRPGSCRSVTRASTRGSRPRAPASTSGAASSRPSKHPYQKNPPSGMLVNWNNRPGAGLGRGRRQLGLRLRSPRATCCWAIWPSATSTTSRRSRAR